MKSMIELKAGLLCLGMRVAADTKDILLKEYPHFADKGFIDAVNAKIRNSNLCISIAEEYSAKSPYILKKTDEQYFVYAGEERFKIDFFPPLPATGTVLDDIARLHADGCINIWPSTSCCYDTPDLKCSFCSLECKNNQPIPIAELCSALQILMQKVPDYTLNFSGGTYQNPDAMADYWMALAKGIRSFSSCPIAVEFAPPTDLRKLKEMKDSGIDAAIMNHEIADADLRKKICPGKSKISYAHYYKAFEEAVNVFGWGQVSSVLIGGIQPKEDILKECEKMAAMGVFPTIMPFRPMDNCELHGLKACDPQELIDMSLRLGILLVKYKLHPHLQEGCTKCGGCSIENDCYLKAKQN